MGFLTHMVLWTAALPFWLKALVVLGEWTAVGIYIRVSGRDGSHGRQ